MTEPCLNQIRAGLDPEIRKGHEGIVYLLGRTDGVVTLAVSVFRPEAETTRGSFFVESRAMAVAVRTAARFAMQIVAQVHTHPGAAFHSGGDVEGAKIRYSGYSSLVIPAYGRNLPNLDGVAAYMFIREQGWVPLGPSSLLIVPTDAR
jgi:hypothetical protein